MVRCTKHIIRLTGYIYITYGLIELGGILQRFLCILARWICKNQRIGLESKIKSWFTICPCQAIYFISHLCEKYYKYAAVRDIIFPRINVYIPIV